MTAEKYVSVYQAYLDELPRIKERLRTRLDGDFMPLRPDDMTDEQVREARDKLSRAVFPERYEKGRAANF
jgi:hypothetical protein